MDPNLMVLAIRSVVRVGTIARDAAEQKVRDQAIALPDVFGPAKDPSMYVEQFFTRTEVYGKYILPHPERDALLKQIGPETEATARKNAISTLTALVDEILAGEPALGVSSAELAAWANGRGRFVLEQWAEGSGPQKPWARVCFELADVALEAVQAYPGVLAGGAAGDKYLRAVCAQLQPLLAREASLDTPGAAFTTRAAAIALQAGLRALGETAPEFIGEEHLEKLVVATVKPLADQFEAVGAGKAELYTIRDTLLGPVVTAAVATLAANQEAFLGRKFGAGTAFGAVAQAFLAQELADGSVKLRDVFSEEGLSTLAHSALGVAAQRPELFVGAGEGDETTLARGLLADLARAVQDTGAPFGSRRATALIAAAAVESFAAHGMQVLSLDPARPWHAAAREAVTRALDEVAGALREAATAPRAERLLTTFFSAEDLTAYARIFLEQAAKTPEMIAGGAARNEVRAIVVALTRALAAQDSILLSSADALEVAAAVAEEAAANPGRLFRLDATDPMESLAAKLIGSILTQAAADMKDGRASGSVLFGETLREALKIAVAAAAGNAQRALENHPKLVGLIAVLDRLAMRSDRPIGRREWLFLFKRLAAQMLADPSKVDTRDDALLALLNVVEVRT